VELKTRTIAVADSVRTFALVRDQVGNPLPVTATVTSCNTGVATVIPTSDAPQVRTAFFVKAVAFSATPVCIAASAAGFYDTMFVTAVPFALFVSGGPANDTVTPTEQSIDLFQHAGQPTDLHLVAGVDHFLMNEGNTLVLNLVRDWLAQRFPAR